MAVAVDQHVADPQVDAPRTRVIDRIRGRSEGWPILALLYGYPILWLLGIGPFFAIGLAIPLACHLALRQRLVVRQDSAKSTRAPI